MTYFSNGSEGSAFQAAMCAKCVHDVNHDCPIWTAHLIYNYGQNSNEALKGVLNMLIPRTADGAGNLDCKLFLPR